MALQIGETHREGVTVLVLSGRITLGEESHLLRNKIRAASGQGRKQLVLDLGDVSYIDSSGLGALVASYSTVASGGGKMKLANLTKRLSDLLAITKLVTIFEVYDSVDAAVRSFEKAPA